MSEASEVWDAKFYFSGKHREIKILELFVPRINSAS